MMPHDVSRYVRQSRMGTFSLATLHVVIWLYFMYRTAQVGQITNTVLGTVFLVSVICLWWLLDHLLGAQAWWMPLLRRSAELEDRVLLLERRIEALQASDNVATTLDLAATPVSHPSELVAATLTESTFPRLVEDRRPTTSVHAGRGETAPAVVADDAAATPSAAQATPASDRPAADLASWRGVLAAGDLVQGRRLLVDWRATRPADFMGAREAELATAEQRVLDGLRGVFARRVRDGAYAEALAIGRRISRLFPDSRPARDFERLRPLLQRRVTGNAGASLVESMGG